MSEHIQALEKQALGELESITAMEALVAWRSRYLGNKGEVRGLFSKIGTIPNEEKAAYGKNVNALKEQLTDAFETRQVLLNSQSIAKDLEEGEIDITLPGRPNPTGGLHPSTQTLRRFYEIWADMGFQVFRSREVEDDKHNFEMLNFPPDHPARDMQDTFYTTDEDVILRTHTSPGQIRSMESLGENGT
ncbi:MAG: phenylalanine--tRNA ligase subunit alpha, partial [Aggregatilineales bacterium]